MDINKHTKFVIFVLFEQKLSAINIHRKYLKNDFLSKSFLLITYKLIIYSNELINEYNKYKITSVNF